VGGGGTERVVRMACVGGVRGIGASGVRVVDSARGAATTRDTSPLISVHDTNASALGEPSPCVSSGQT
jgi:hypothetical protein